MRADRTEFADYRRYSRAAAKFRRYRAAVMRRASPLAQFRSNWQKTTVSVD
ncbi:hypothetical protein [Paraburkholderia silvatlantica]|uniref:Uncharacterized protein n=1 Tax=Paraburkholderia silvatlantica TaxID=321895 RepID=A0ABR6FHL7_9BURK|nr:hypothetical protein [Paraburkholderia silvatlantica]MBB2926911.1 hypothetical protein [Paraburkholderia silvatlantica]